MKYLIGQHCPVPLKLKLKSNMFLQVVRTVVFSSARSDTDKDSSRMQMFESMREKNFEVHMATTMGVQEKCIDIALAVEMMHYATIPDTYDVGGELCDINCRPRHLF